MHRADRPTLAIHPVNIAVEKYYNAIPGDDDKPDTSPERLITQYIDTPIINVLRKIDVGTVLNAEDSVRLAVFVVFQFYRSPMNKERIKSLASRKFQESLEELVEDPAAVNAGAIEAGVSVDEEDVQRLSDLVRAGEIAVSATNAPWLEYAFDAARRIAPHLVGERTWSLCSGPSGFEFVTSDNPVQQFFFSDHAGKSDVEVWTSPDTMTVLPIDPKTCVVIHRLHGRAPRWQLNPTQARGVNRAMITGCSRMVFSRREERFVRTILDKQHADFMTR